MQVENIALAVNSDFVFGEFGCLVTLFPLMPHNSYFNFVSGKLAKSIPVKIREVRFCYWKLTKEIV